ncbi:MAG: hypothetical protein N2483_00100, partial [Burkholderiaceae bacterium]|nr:hypothetical protein [Burkholderiaceae bacterium]
MNGILLPAQAAGASPAPSAAAADVVVEGEAFAAVIARHAQALRVDAAHVADTQFPSEHTASDDENDGQQRAAVAADANAALASAMLHDLSAAAQLVTATACQSAVPLQPDNDAQPPAGKTAISAPPRSPARGLPLVAACGEDRRAAPPPADAIALAAIPPRPSAAEPAQLPDRPAAASGPQRSG